ncbi:hypothetical protein BTA31_18185 [Bacillus haynesii]|uniref:Transposase n=1 Tax=Bacillus haynesii TaxID=1925021 RepID=A0ABX3HZG5_9BACI|nr:hypothetical protein BTA31_18185 [Bacillus haynesii]
MKQEKPKKQRNFRLSNCLKPRFHNGVSCSSCQNASVLTDIVYTGETKGGKAVKKKRFKLKLGTKINLLVLTKSQNDF